jgi:hypothetical protein
MWKEATVASLDELSRNSPGRNYGNYQILKWWYPGSEPRFQLGVSPKSKVTLGFIHLLGLFFTPENGGRTFLRNVGELSDYTALYSRKKCSSRTLLRGSQIKIILAAVSRDFQMGLLRWVKYTNERWLKKLCSGKHFDVILLKFMPLTGVEAHRIVRLWGCHTF